MCVLESRSEMDDREREGLLEYSRYRRQVQIQRGRTVREDWGDVRERHIPITMDR